MSGLGTIYLLIFLIPQLFPQVAFGYSIKAQGIQIYSTTPIGEAEAVCSAIRSKITDSSLYDDDDTFTVLICNGKWLYTFFNPLSHGDSFGMTNPITQRIIMAEVDVSNDQARRFGEGHSTRSFVGVVGHEAGHLLMRRRLGYLTLFRVPTWLKEGYCEMLAGESSFPEETGDNLLSQGKSEDSESFNYFQYRRMVEYLIQEKGYTIEELVRNVPNEEAVKNETSEWIRKRLGKQ